MTDKSRADELHGVALVEFVEGPVWCVKRDKAKRIIRELEERIAAMEDAAGPLVSDLHREMDRRMAAEQRVREPVHPAIPEPLRKLVRAVRRLKLACGYVGSMGKRSRVVARSECIYALEALPPDVLTACLKETDR